MVIQTELYPSGGGYQQESYTVYQGYGGSHPDGGGYSNFPGLNTGHSGPYSTYPQFSTNPTGHAQHQQPGWSTGGDYHGNGGNHYSGAVKPAHGGYGSSYYENTHSHANSHGQGSPHGHGGQHGYGSPPGRGSPHEYGSHTGYGSQHQHGNSNGYGSGPSNLINRLTHGLHGYGSSAPNYGNGHNGVNHGSQKPSWVLKGLDGE